MRKAVFYHFFDSGQNSRRNAEYFLRYGVDKNADYFFCTSGTSFIDANTRENVKFLQFRNYDFDFGAFQSALNIVENIFDYDLLFFLNCTVRGPFLPAYESRSWHDIFGSLLKDDVHLAGSTINILPQNSQYYQAFCSLYGPQPSLSHVQTMAYAMTREAMFFLKNNGFYNRDLRSNKANAILHYEILMSKLITANGWNISCMIPEYQKIDYRLPHSDINEYSRLGDPCYKGALFGRTIHPFETVFIKTNRDIASEIELTSLEKSQSAINFHISI